MNKLYCFVDDDMEYYFDSFDKMMEFIKGYDEDYYDFLIEEYNTKDYYNGKDLGSSLAHEIELQNNEF